MGINLSHLLPDDLFVLVSQLETIPATQIFHAFQSMHLAVHEPQQSPNVENLSKFTTRKKS
jgi:hypothetical protein